jgi:hypothetical protein
MDETDRDKLVKVLRMFGSDHDGEVTSAARRAHHILKTHALDWDDLIIQEGRRSEPRQERNKPPRHDPDDDEADLIHRCAERPKCLSAWEQDFIRSIGESIIEWGRLTPKQRAILDRIVNKLKVQGVWDDYEE